MPKKSQDSARNLEVVKEQEPTPSPKAAKVTNPVWVGNLAPFIKKYLDLFRPDGITYESLYAYFCQLVQFGGNVSELWAVVDEDGSPMAFAQWQVKSLPYIGTVEINYIYNWSKKNEAVKLLMDEYEDFSLRCRASIGYGNAANPRLLEYWKKVAEKRGYKFKTQPFINFVMGKRLREE